MNEKMYKAVDQFAFEDIHKFFKKNISGKPYVLTVVGKDDKVNWVELNKFGTVKKLSLEQIFGY